MAGNFVENCYLSNAILELGKQHERKGFGPANEIRLGEKPLMLTNDGRLTVVRRVRLVNGKKLCEPDTRYDPVDCYNIIPDPKRYDPSSAAD